MVAAFHSFAHLFVHILLRWITFLGTSPGGIAAQLALVLITEARSGWWRVRAWKENWQGGLKRALYALLVVWVIAFFVCTITTVYDDHKSLASSNAALRAENSKLSIRSETPCPQIPTITLHSYRNEMTVRQVSRLRERFAGAIRQAQPITFVITYPVGSEKFKEDVYSLVVDACSTAIPQGSPCSIELPANPKLEIDTGIPSPAHSGIVVHASDSTASAARQYLAQYVLGTCYKTLYSPAMPDAIMKLNGPHSSNFVWLELGAGSPWNLSGGC
jgi:hypothetical protein